jgi:PPK2 family polyphosphate:nucleotide phosphotransferase
MRREVAGMGGSPEKPFRVPFDGKVSLADLPTRPPEDAPSKDESRAELAVLHKRMDELQRKMYADDRHALLLIFQAMDAAGKDGTIRAVFTGLDPAGVHVTPFKAPSAEELDHDFLWRHIRNLPERGRIGVFNRSWYEEVLVTRVVPEILDRQKLPRRPADIFEERYDSIRDFERHLARNGTTVIKFYLHVSAEEQRDRLLARLDDPEKNWKFEAGDLDARDRWKKFARAYEQAMAATSRAHAPWFVIPADQKAYMRLAVARVVLSALEGMDLDWPRLSAEEQAQLGKLRSRLG